MKGLRNAAIFLLSTTLSLQFDHAGAQALSCPSTLDGFHQIDDAASVNYAVVPSDPAGSGNGLFCARLEVVDHEGWISLAISDGKGMTGNAVIGVPGFEMESVLKYNLAPYNPTAVVDDKQTLMNASVSTTAEEGKTIMEYAKFLVEGGEIPILEDGNNIFLHARGGSSLTYHSVRMRFDLTFDSTTSVPGLFVGTDGGDTSVQAVDVDVPGVGDSAEICSVCPNGITADEDHLNFFASIQDDDDDGIFASMQGDAWDDDNGDAGLFASQGDDAQDNDDFFDDAMNLSDPVLICEQALEPSKMAEADPQMCKEIEHLCCPSAATNPCPICPNGINVNEDYFNLLDSWGDDAMGLSDPVLFCELAIKPFNTIEAGSDMCAESKEETEMMCCPTLAMNPCPICPNGISSGGANPFASLFGDLGEGFDDNSGDDGANDLSSNITTDGLDLGFCELAAGSGKYMEADSEECKEAVGGVSFLCCPADAQSESPCTFCPDGITTDVNHYLSLGLNETEAAEAAAGCQQMAGLVQIFEAGTEDCNGMANLALSCCPLGTQVEVEGKCSFCEDGITLDENSPYLAGYSESEIAETVSVCEQMKGYASRFDEGSDSCNEMDESQMSCCPAPLENGCNPCPNSINGDGNPMIGDNETDLEEHMSMCQWGLSYLNMFETESEECKQDSDYYKMICCPTPVENPCTICPNGIAPIEEHPFSDFLGENEAEQAANHASCAPSIGVYAQVFEANSDTCLEVTQYLPLACCPTEHQNPCLVCPSGVTVPTDDEFYDECIQNIEFAKIFEADTDMCDDTFQSYEFYCCPMSVSNPCTLCPEGYSLNENAVIESGEICGISLTIEEGSPDCEEGKQQGLQSICCSLLSHPIETLPSPIETQEPPTSTADPIQALPSPTDLVETQETTTSPTEDSLSTNPPTVSSTDDSLSTNAPTTSSTDDSLTTYAPTASSTDDSLTTKAPTASSTTDRASATPTSSSTTSKEPAALQPPDTGPPTEPVSPQASERTTSAPNSSAPTMGILLSAMLLLVATNVLAWTV